MMHVRKYGGSSVATMEQINEICRHLPNEPIVVVVSAPYGRTANLYSQLDNKSPSTAFNHLIALGEQESCLKFKICLESLGRDAEIIDYKSAGIIASSSHGGYIVDCNAGYIQSRMAKNKIIIIPGFQGLYRDEIAILSKGASDDTAVALSIALRCPCYIFSNVPFIRSTSNQRYQQISYNTLLNIITNYQAPMSRSSILMAKAHNKRIYFGFWQPKKHKDKKAGTFIGHEDKILNNKCEKNH
ncbi:MAG: hypothetical protein VXW87_03365 [Pseudomonadota bacterium]|nr:hypothetical protein [Pseudomonadota bacterium]